MTSPLAPETRPTRLARFLPWTRLFRGPAIALDTRKMLLAALGLVLSWAGLTALDLALLPGRTLDSIDPMAIVEPFPGVGSSLFDYPARVAEPFALLIAPFVRLFRLNQALPSFVHAILSSIWLVIVWGTIGGAIARIAAVQQATGSRIGLIPAVRFALSRFIPLVGAPLSPLIGIGFFAALCLPLGLLFQIPGRTGTILSVVFGVLPLLAGLVMALLLAGLAIGWPLMTATVAVEAEDAFDALSRSYSYVTQRTGRYVAYALISWGIGCVSYLVVTVMAALVLHMASWGLAFGGPNSQLARLFPGDRPVGTPPMSPHPFWIGFVRLLVHGWTYSYFFSSATLIYVLLRKDVDGAAFHDLGGTKLDDQPFAASDGPGDRAMEKTLDASGDKALIS